MSNCDTCRQPGACCMGFTLSNKNGPLTHWDSSTRQQIVDEVANHHFLPFRPIAKRQTGTDDVSGATYSSWYWGCPRLGADGRCSDYENRPQLCRDYQAGHDPLCVEFKGIPVTALTT